MRDKFRLPKGVKAANSMLQRRGFQVWVWRFSLGTTIEELEDRRQEWLWQQVEGRGAAGERRGSKAVLWERERMWGEDYKNISKYGRPLPVIGYDGKIPTK